VEIKNKDIMNALKRSEVFLGLEDASLEKIASLASSIEKIIQPGEVLFQSGERADYVYILKEGRIDLIAGAEVSELSKQKIVVDKVTVGGLLGWSALVAPFYYVFTAVALTPSIVVCINGRELLALSNQNYYIGYRVFKGIAFIIGNRLRDYEQVLLRGRRWPFLNGDTR
jgi:CRP-like cAMP-binding protein